MLLTLLVSSSLFWASQGALEEYTLYAPVRSTTTYLVDHGGEIAHEWESGTQTGHEAILMKDGALLRAGKLNHPRFRGGGQGGRLEILETDGTIRWRWDCVDAYLQHHDMELLDNGNILLIAWEHLSQEQAIALGREPDSIDSKGMWPDSILEIKPILPDKHALVWEWHARDHLVQDRDAEKPNFELIHDAPHRLDINYGVVDTREREEILEEMKQLAELGYIDTELLEEEEQRNTREQRKDPDWMHSNAISYNPTKDLIALSLRNMSEIWIIDHSTTSAEAATSAGGNQGQGGDILWRWGTPSVYKRGDEDDRKLFGQHDVRWIAAGWDGAHNLTVFNNGEGRGWSSVDQIVPPFLEDSLAPAPAKDAWGPTALSWTYAARNKRSLYSGHIAGANRLANGNTLIAAGEQGRIIEVNKEGKVVWEHQVPKERLLGNNERPSPRRRGPKQGGPPGNGGLWRAYRYSADDAPISVILKTKE